MINTNKNYMTVELSPKNLNKIITNKGKKDLTLQSSGETMNLAHIHFQIDRYLNKIEGKKNSKASAENFFK